MTHVQTAADQPGRRHTGADTPTSLASSLHVLLVDDQSSMRSILRRILSDIGVRRISEAEDGRDALDLLKINWHDLPDLVICDLYMKHVDGLEFCRRMSARMRNDGRQIPILMLTGEQDLFIHDVACQVGASKVLTKPVTPSELLDEVSQVIGCTLEQA